MILHVLAIFPSCTACISLSLNLSICKGSLFTFHYKNVTLMRAVLIESNFFQPKSKPLSKQVVTGSISQPCILSNQN